MTVKYDKSGDKLRKTLPLEHYNIARAEEGMPGQEGEDRGSQNCPYVQGLQHNPHIEQSSPGDENWSGSPEEAGQLGADFLVWSRLQLDRVAALVSPRFGLK